MKNKKLLFLVAFALFGILEIFNPLKVNAAYNETLVEEKIPNVWYTRRGGGKPYMSAQYTTYTMNGKVVYCIEPGVDITVHSYLGYDGLVASPYDDATNKLIELIGHYGYNYPGHQTLRYRMATQALIWEETGGQILEFWTEASGWGDYINLNYERNEIMKLVNAHYNKPSFNGQTIEAVIGQEFKITDTNGLLSEYEIYNSKNFSIRIDGNDIYATPLAVGDLTLSVVRKHYDNETTIVYHGTDGASQKMGYFRFSDPVMASVKVKTIGGDIAINKLDNDTQSSQTQGAEASLEGAVYGIYNYNDTLITTITTDKNGYAKSGILPDIGDYYLKEITPSKGYQLDMNKYYFTISTKYLHPVINVYEEIIERDVEINKFFASDETGTLTPESGIEFGIYDINGKHISTIKTDSQGFAKINLVYGTYTFKQLNTTAGHEKVKDFVVKVNSESPQIIKYSLSNAPITAKLRLVKIDSESKKTILLSGVTFKIKNVDTQEYVCQSVSYPNKEEICSYKTNDKGEFTTPYELVSGTYQIEEITSPSGYLLSMDYLVFRIDDNTTFIEDEEYGKYINVEFANTKIKGNITIEKTGELFKIGENTFSYELTTLEGIEFALYADEDITTLDGITHYKKGDLIKTIKTDKNGKATFNDLYLGKYIIKEIKTLDNYVLDTKEYAVELIEIDNKTAIVSETLKLNNELKKSDLIFTKTDLVDGEVIPNTVIEVYTSNDECIFVGTTDDKGQITIKDLSVGRYYIIEKQPATGYVITEEKVEFEILEDGSVVKAEMKNKPITGSLHFSKVDLSTQEALPNTTISIFKQISDEEYEKVFEGVTDENGMIIIDELTYGKYYILETNAPEGYILNEEKMFFEILHDGEIVKTTMVNEKVVIEVPNTLLNDSLIIEIVSATLLIAGIGIIIYVKKKNRNKK